MLSMGYKDQNADLNQDPPPVPDANLKTAVKEVLKKVDNIANDSTYGASGRGIYGLMAALRNIIGYIINQDSYDNGGYSSGERNHDG